MAVERTVLVRLKGQVSDFNRAMLSAAAGVAALRKEIDSTNDRTAWLVQGVLALAPALVPLGAAAVPVVAGLATQMTVAAGAAGVALLAFNGVGDALKALNDYQLDPTNENLQQLNETMAKIGPSGEKFVRFLDDIGGQWSALADTAREPIFEGMTESIKTLTTDLLPRLKVITREIAEGIGQLSTDAGEGLSGSGFEAFFEYLRTDAQDILVDMGRTLGNFLQGIGGLMVAFGPLTERFSNGLLEMSRSFASWSEGLGSDNSFQSFLAYINESIPMAMDFLSSLIGAITALTVAAAPVGELLLPAFTAFLNVVEQLAATPLGPMFLAAASAVSILGRAQALATITTGGMIGKLTAGTRENAAAAMKATVSWRELGNAMVYAGHSQRDFNRLAAIGPIGKENAAYAMNARRNVVEYGKAIAGTAAQVGGLALVMSDLDDKAGLTNTAMLALMGSMAGPYGAAAGAAVGFTIDLSHANDDLTASIERGKAALEGQQKPMSELKATYDELNTQIAAGLAKKSPLWHYLNDDELSDAMAEREFVLQQIIKQEEQLKLVSAADPNRGQGQMFRDLQSDANAAAVAMENLANEIQSVSNLLDRSGSLIAYESALDDLTESIKENGQSWDVGTRAGQDNLTKRNALVEKAIQRSQVLKEQGDDLGAQRILQRAISDLEAFARQSPAAKAAMQPLIAELKNVNGMEAKPKVTVEGTESAVAQLNTVRTAAEAAERTYNIYIVTTRINKVENQMGGQPKIATGGYISGPGGPTDDLIDAKLSNGEYVQKAAAVAKYGVKMMDDINNLRFAHGGLVKRFATGGWTGGSTWGYNPTQYQRTGWVGGSQWDMSQSGDYGISMKFMLERFREVWGQFEATLEDGAAALQKELRHLAIDVKAAKGEWTNSLRQQAKELTSLSTQYDRHVAALTAAQEALNATTAQIEEMTQQRDALASSVAGQFNSQITGQGGLAAAMRTLQGDIAGGAQMTNLLEVLKGLGLDATGPRSGLYRALLESNDVKLASQLAAGGAGAVDYLEGLYAERDAQNTMRGIAAGQEAFGDSLRDLALVSKDQLAEVNRQTARLEEIDKTFNAQLQALRDELKGQVPDAIGREVGEALTSATASGAQRGQREQGGGTWTQYWK